MARNYNKWTREERDTLTRLYATASMLDVAASLPGRTQSQIHDCACRMGITRQKPGRRTREETLAAKRDGMRRQREQDPEGVRARHAAWRAQNIERERAKMRDYHGRRFFWSKSMKLRGEHRATARDLASLWRKQRGLCGLTGRRLDRSAQLDHIVPRASGGTDDPMNLQWLCADANLAKRALSQGDFLSLCSDVSAWAQR